MRNDTTLQELVNSFQRGLFFNLSEKAWKLPNGIGQLLEMDDTGCCWFLFNISPEVSGLYENEFPARIRLYEKGRDCYVEANGKAVILKDPEEWSECSKISDGMSKALCYHGLIVRIRIQHATVTEAVRSTRRNFWQKMMDELTILISGKNISEKVYQPSVLSQ